MVPLELAARGAEHHAAHGSDGDHDGVHEHGAPHALAANEQCARRERRRGGERGQDVRQELGARHRKEHQNDDEPDREEEIVGIGRGTGAPRIHHLPNGARRHENPRDESNQECRDEIVHGPGAPGLAGSTSTNQGIATAANTTGAGDQSASPMRRHRPVAAAQAMSTNPGNTIPMRPLANTASATHAPNAASAPRAEAARSRAMTNRRSARNAPVMAQVRTPSVKLYRPNTKLSGAESKMSAAHSPHPGNAGESSSIASIAAVPTAASRVGSRAAYASSPNTFIEA